MSARYFEDFAVGRGRLAPRAVLDSDAPRIDLNGQWAFRFSPALRTEPDGFQDPQFDDGSWGALAVPSHWQLRGHGRPVCVNVAYLIPLDPPFVPDENETGDSPRPVTPSSCPPARWSTCTPTTPSRAWAVLPAAPASCPSTGWNSAPRTSLSSSRRCAKY